MSLIRSLAELPKKEYIHINTFEVVNSIKDRLPNFSDKLTDVYNSHFYQSGDCGVVVSKEDDDTLLLRILCQMPACNRCKCPMKYSHKRWNEWRNKHKDADAIASRNASQTTDNIADVCCEICAAGGDDPDDPDMLLCDGCGRGFHYHCIDLDGIPKGNSWYCDIACMAEHAPEKPLTAPQLLRFYTEHKKLKASHEKVTAESSANINTLQTQIARLQHDLKQRRQSLNGSGGRHMQVVNANDDDTSSKCVICKENSAAYIDLKNCKQPYKNKDPRRRKAILIYDNVLTTNMVCRNPLCLVDTFHIDKANRFKFCIICRIQRVQSNGECCSECAPHCANMATNHATDKIAFKKAMMLLQHTVYDINQVRFHNEYQVSQGTAIDTVIEIDDIRNHKHVFVIEFQNTCKEDVSTLTHKYAQVCKTFNPYRSYIFCVRIGDVNIEPNYTHAQRLDIVRRWIILAIIYGDKLPLRNHWWFFWNNPTTTSGASPLKPSEYKSPFMNEAVIKINYPPEGIKSDWEFATDMLAGHITPLKKKRDADGNLKKHVFSWIKEHQKAPTTVLGSNFPDEYTKFKVEQMSDMHCKPDCSICADFYGTPPA